MIAKRVEDVDWQAFKTSFDRQAPLVQEKRHRSQALKSALGATQTLDAQLQEPNANDGDPRPEEPSNGCSGQTEHPELESLRRAHGLLQEPSDGPAPEFVNGNREGYLPGTTAFNGEIFDDLGNLQALPNLSPEQMDGLELNMCVQGSMAQQDGTSAGQCQGSWQPTCAGNVGSDELVGEEPDESMVQEGCLGFGNDGLIPEIPTSTNSPAIQLESMGFLIKALINNQAHSLRTPVIDAMGSLLAFTESQNWTIIDVMTTSERVLRIQMSGSVEDFKYSSAMGSTTILGFMHQQHSDNQIHFDQLEPDL